MTTPQEPHFLKPLLPGFHSGVTIPLEFFSKHIQGSEKNKPWKLRSDASDQVWEVIREGRTLTKGWKEFATAHDLRIGDIVIFKHEGDLVFHVTPFVLAVVRFSIQILTTLRKKPTRMMLLLSHSTIASWLRSLLQIKRKITCFFRGSYARTALNQQCKEVKLVNKDGKSWTASFGFSESDGAYYISRGWRKFCRDNKCTNGDLFVFNVVGDGTTTPLLCVCPERKEGTELLINHFSRIND
ncbi:hypothetical protein Bca52824_091946 [Brassica carinata]|uniref:TF-B3 domain-containing protein n=1 Tax=Brassica carinata TaxID=52824 RepID=A0A8X7NTJ2_BRACI|nr:hypothetical protein Bca52824_091946 [Brassica carinata]